MNFLKNLTVRSRIGILVLIPLLAIAIYSCRTLVSAAAVSSSMGDLGVSLRYVQLLAPVFEDLASEQVATTAFVKGPDESAASNKRQMEQARSQSDRDIAALRQYMGENSGVLVQVFGSKDDFDFVGRKLSQLSPIRKTADQKAESSDAYKSEYDGNTVWSCVDIDRLREALLDTVSHVAAYAGGDREVSHYANAYYMLLKDRSASGSLNNAVLELTKYNVSGYNFGQVMHYRAIEETCRNFARLYATGPMKAVFKKELEDPGYIAKAVSTYWEAFDAYKLTDKAPLEIKSVPDFASFSRDMASAYDRACAQGLEMLSKAGQERRASAMASFWFDLVLSIALIAIVLAISLFVMRSITYPLQKCVGTMAAFARDKDMSLRLDDSSKSEFGSLSRAFNDLVMNFNKTLLSVRDQAQGTADGVGKCTGMMEQSSELTERQLSSTDSIAAAMNEMTTNISEVSGVAKKAAHEVDNAHEVSVKSEEGWEVARQKLNALNEGLAGARDAVLMLNKQTEKIGGILDLIQSIAEQTNLLALNAAIEAARAGESGKGFAVVADEVRTLARRTQEATTQIRKQFESMVSDAAAASSNMDSLRDEGEKSVQLVKESATAFTRIREELDNIMQQTSVLANAASEQAQASEHINERIQAVKDASVELERNASASGQTMRSLKEESDILREQIAAFKLEEA